MIPGIAALAVLAPLGFALSAYGQYRLLRTRLVEARVQSVDEQLGTFGEALQPRHFDAVGRAAQVRIMLAGLSPSLTDELVRPRVPR